MLRSLSEHSLMVFDSFIFYSSKSLIKFKTCIPLILSFSSYFVFRYSHIAFADLSDMIQIKIVDETTTNKQAFAFDFLIFLSF